MKLTEKSLLRRPYQAACGLLMALTMLSLGADGELQAETKGKTRFVPFVAYGASATSQELVAVRFKEVDGKITTQVVQREPLGCQGAPVVFHSRHRLVYVASLRAKKGNDNKIIVFGVGAAGRLTRRASFPLKHGSAYLSLDRGGKYLLSASYFDGHVDVYRLGPDGMPQSHVGTTFEKQNKAHSILTSPNNRFAYVPYVKENNGLFQYSFDAKTGKLRPLQPAKADVPAGVGPRHVAYHPTKPFVFFSNEQHLGATSYRINDDGRLKLLQVCDPGDLKPAEGLASSDICITRNGRFLYVGMRDFSGGKKDAIHGYAIQSDGRLKHLGSTAADAIPWGLELSADGRQLLVSAAHGETLTAFRIGDKGQLTKRVAIQWGKMIRDIAVIASE